MGRQATWGAIAGLWMGAVITALAVVDTSYQVRAAIRELEALRHTAAALEVRSGQFLLERGALANYARIEARATDELSMTVPDADHLVIITP
jgi:cell division protein FtsL